MSEVRFNHPASQWNDALPIGNGFLGAMVFGGIESERIQVNEDSVWSGGPMERVNPDCLEHLDEIRDLLVMEKPREAEQLASRAMYATYPHMRHYQNLGDVWINFAQTGAKSIMRLGQNDAKDYSRVLDLNHAVGYVSYTADGGNHKRTFFASNPANVCVYHIEAPAGETISCDVRISRKDNRPGRGSSYCDGCQAIAPNTIRLWGVNGGDNGISFEFVVRIVTASGTTARMGSSIVVKDAPELTVFITARTSVRSKDPLSWCLDKLNQAEAYGFSRLLADHVADYRNYFDRCHLELGSKDDDFADQTTANRLENLRKGHVDAKLIETYFDFGRYLLISSSREGSLPTNLQGIWNDEFEPAWGSKYTININTQMNYWPAEQTGLGDLHKPIFDHLARMLPKGQKVAREMYGARGFCCHHNTDIWGDCAPQDANVSATIWPLGAAWLCLDIIEHWRYTKDSMFLEQNYAILREAVLFLNDYLLQDKHGRWVTGPSTSPENTYRTGSKTVGNLCMGPSMDTQIVRELFSGFLSIARSSYPNDPIIHSVEEKLPHLPDIEIGKLGTIMEWAEDYDEVEPGHRHIAHLFALYPGTQIRPDKTPELAVAAAKTLERRLSFGGGHTGWSKAWITLLYARLHNAKKAWENLTGLLSNSTLDNLFDTHPPFQIDGNFGGTAAILEMLVQDYENDVYLLPALPKQLPNGSVRGIRLMCGATINLSWRNGELHSLTLTGLRDGVVSLHYKGVIKATSFAAGEQYTFTQFMES